MLNKLSTIYVQGESDKKNFEQLTTHKVQVMGNLKFDQMPTKETEQNSKKMKNDLMINDQIVIVAGSTRKGEEEIILNEILKMNKKNISLILTQRHQERFCKVESLLKSKNVKFAKRSKASSVKLTPNFILGDSMNEMYMYYALANVVIIGGSFFNYGSQNPIEPLKMKKPTIIGPSIFNFKDIILGAIKSKAAIQINHVHELPKTISKLSNLEKIGRAHV